MALHLSGVIAVVTTGLAMGRAQHRIAGPRSRLAGRAVWDFLGFILNNLVFILIGLQLNDILGRLDGRPWWEIVGIDLALAAALILSRFLWVFPATWLPQLIPAVRQPSRFSPGPRRRSSPGPGCAAW
ncbi:cation:proton antiporter [Siccirubricoccus sp. G192]|uniref:cation:proton antiporter domain-containing protein n=1 Tax=Siccirubricoccus sp. G192 TaxID=2849651 RepID=UPI001C2BEB03|nr:cation:proton antiporter [Siccirubricoccus sp. G192]